MQDVVSQGEQDAPFIQKFGTQVTAQLLGFLGCPVLENTAFGMMLVQDVQNESAVGVHAARYCPTGHELVEQGVQVAPVRKKPSSHAHSQASLPKAVAVK
jgi:hypothetical protein